MSSHPDSSYPSSLRWLWILSALGGGLGFGCAILIFLALRTLPIPGLHDWFLHSFSLIGLSLLFIGWLTGLGLLLTHAVTGLFLWTRNSKQGNDPVSAFSGMLGFSACAALASSALFLLTWRTVPHAPYLALGWPIIASILQLTLMAAATPCFFLIVQADRFLARQDGTFASLLRTILEQSRGTVRSQLPRILIALHATGLSLALWISPIAKSLEFRNTHHILINLLQALVLILLVAGHLWLARSALLAALRNNIAQRISQPMTQLAQHLPAPPKEILQLFNPPKELSILIRLPWSLVAGRFSPIIDRWSEWTQDKQPAEKLREFLSTEVPGLTGPILLALLQILVALVPSLLWM